MSGGSAEESLWMVPFADLMSILVLLFMALYGYAMIGKDAAYEQALARLGHELSDTEIEKLGSLARRNELEVAEWIEKHIQKALPQGKVGIDYSEHRIRIRFSGPVLFHSGSARLNPQAKEMLRGLAKKLKPLPNLLRVDGHTDPVPITKARYRTNWELSAARAFSVIDVFIQEGVEAERLYAYGYGEHRPIADNSTPLGRSQNRRIELTLIREGKQQDEANPAPPDSVKQSATQEEDG